MQCFGPTTQQQRQPGRRQFFVKPFTIHIGSLFTSSTNSSLQFLLQRRGRRDVVRDRAVGLDRAHLDVVGGVGLRRHGDRGLGNAVDAGRDVQLSKELINTFLRGDRTGRDGGGERRDECEEREAHI